MTRVYCDICGKEVVRKKEIWKHTLAAREGNKRVSYDEHMEEICESCATTIHCCTSMMKQGWKPDFHEMKEAAAAAADGADQPTLMPGA